MTTQDPTPSPITPKTSEQPISPSNHPAQPNNTLRPEEPYSIFSPRQKSLIVFLASTAATFSGLASNIYFPALPSIASDLHVSIFAVNLTVTSYLVFQGLAPSLWGTVSDVYGRRVAYVCTFVVFLGACVGLGLSKSYVALVVLRCVQSAGSASSIAIGAGVIGDITTRAERGGYMGVFQAGLLAPVAVGPVIGGAISGAVGWRAIFWVLAGYAAVFLMVLIALLPETLRALVGNGARVPGSLIVRHPLSIYQRLTNVSFERQQGSLHHPVPPPRLDVLSPLRILTTKHACPIILFLAVYYAVWQMSITAMSTLFASRYALSQTQIGLTFIANGVGSILGTLSTGKLLDKDYKRVQRAFEAQCGGASPHAFPLEKARLRFVPLLSAIQCTSILLFGWTVAYPARVHIAVPIVSTFITGWTAVSMQSVVTTYLVDVFAGRSAAAGASLNLARCLFAAGGTSFVMPMVDGVGVGWAFTICVGVQVVALGGLAVQWRCAGRWRIEDEVRKRGGEGRGEGGGGGACGFEEDVHKGRCDAPMRLRGRV